MHVAVTGASGFLGPKMISHLADNGHTGVAISRREFRELPSGWTWRSRRDALEAAESARKRLDWIIHLEVKQHVDAPSDQDIEDFARTNVDGTRMWLKWCTKHNVRRFVHFSTIKAVGDATAMRDESAASQPSTLYGISKRDAENLVRAWAAQSRERCALILRPAVIYGPGNQANVFSMVRAIDRGMFFLVGANRNVKSLVSVANAAAAVTHLMDKASPGCEVYNIVDRESYSVRQISEMILSLLEKKGKVRTMPLPVARAAANLGYILKRLTGKSLPLTPNRLKALTETTHFDGRKLIESGFNHPQSTEEGLREMVTWYRQEKS